MQIDFFFKEIKLMATRGEGGIDEKVNGDSNCVIPWHSGRWLLELGAHSEVHKYQIASLYT